MTNTATDAPITSRRLNLREIGPSFAAIIGLVCDALNLAYVDPYSNLRLQPHADPDYDLEGRDPTW